MPLLSGLQFCFRTNETSGNRVDSVAGLQLAPTGTIGSAAGKFGNAVDIGGGTSRLAQTVSSTLTAGTGAFTVMCWVRYDTLSTSYPVARWDGIGDWLFFVSGTGRAGFEIRHNNDSTNTSAQTPSGAIITGEWYMLIGWFDPSVGANGTAYVQLNNGTVYSAALTLPKNNPANLLMSVGVINPTAGVFGSTDGRVDQVCKWNRVLTADERAELWNNGDGKAFPFVTGIGGEVGWWCPSLDDAGNGTTNLLDLSGVNNNRGTLTNMDAATDWVADTDSGGVRALDFDGINDYGEISSSFVLTGAFSISWWENLNAVNSFHAVASIKTSASSSSFIIYRSTNSSYQFLTWRNTTSSPQSAFRASNASNLSMGSWRHFCITGINLASSMIGDFQAYENGVPLIVTTAGNFVASTFVNSIARDGLGTFNNAKFDDIRIFNRVLTTSEVQALASKRGYQPTPNTRRRRYSGSYGL